MRISIALCAVCEGCILQPMATEVRSEVFEEGRRLRRGEERVRWSVGWIDRDVLHTAAGAHLPEACERPLEVGCVVV